MNEKITNSVYLFDKHHISQSEAEEYTTKNPDLTSSDLTEEELEHYSTKAFFKEESQLADYLHRRAEDQANH